jgi:phospholipase C
MRRAVFMSGAILAVVGAASAAVGSTERAKVAPTSNVPIKHVVIIMQENRSFDHYFGTYPGADGLPRNSDGTFAVCNPDPATGQCVAPYHEPKDPMHGGPHSMTSARNVVNGGRMDGFVAEQRRAAYASCTGDTAGACGAPAVEPDVMGYKDETDIPNYWTYAREFVLQDRMFSPVASWSLPQHLYMVSGWSARCSSDDPNSCVSEAQRPGAPPDWKSRLWNLNHPDNNRLRPANFPDPTYAWTDITYLLEKNNVSWGYYVFGGKEPDCRDDEALSCQLENQNAWTPGIWNPLPYFTDVRSSDAIDNVLPMKVFEREVRRGAMRTVSWVIPNNKVAEHPLGKVADGQAWVTRVVNAIMRSPEWRSTAIFVSWDEWGGFYDHVVPPDIDAVGYGLRVPGLVISPYAKRGYIDHQLLSHDAYLKLIEDWFLDGQRLDPTTDGRPDPRPIVREDVPELGDLRNDFDFNQTPRPPLLLEPYPKGDSPLPTSDDDGSTAQKNAKPTPSR